MSEKPVTDYWYGFDTETQDGIAVLLTRKDSYLLFPKSFDAVAEFLLRYRHNVAFNLEYDVRACLAYLPPEVWQSLYYTKGATHGPWKLGYLPGKRFVITDTRTGARASYYDAYPFFQQTLEAAARATLGEGKAEIPRAWYSRMEPLLRRKGWRREKIIAYGKIGRAHV